MGTEIKAISALPRLEFVSGTEMIPVEFDGSTYKLEAAEIATSSGVRISVLPPESLTWKPPFSVWLRQDGIYETDFNIRDYWPVGTPDATIYVSPTGSDASSGLTSETPKLNLSTAVATAKAATGSGDICKIVMAPGDYVGLSQVGDGLTFDDRQWILESSGDGHAVIGIYSEHTWAKTGGQTNVYQTASTAYPVQDWSFDSGVLDSFGLHTRLTLVASVAAVDSTPGSYYESGGIIYVHTADSRVADSFLRLYEDREAIIISAQSSPCSIAMDKIAIYGGNAGSLLPVDGTDDPNVYASKCIFGYGMGDGAVEGHGGGNLFFSKCTVLRPNQDGFNYHEETRAVAKIVEVACLALYPGDGSDGDNDQGSTLHDSLKGVSVNCIYIGGAGQGIGDINTGTERWAVGCLSGDSRMLASPAASRNGGFVAFTDAKLWLDGCREYNNNYAAIAWAGAAVHTRNCQFIAGYRTEGDGVIEDFGNDTMPFRGSRFLLTNEKPKAPDYSHAINRVIFDTNAFDVLGYVVTLNGTGHTYVAGPLGKSLVLPGGSGNQVTITSKTTGFTECVLDWFGELTSTVQWLCSVQAEAAKEVVALRRLSGDKVGAYWTDSAGVEQVLPTTSRVADGTHRMQISHDGSTVKLFVDGELVAIETGQSLISTSTGEVRVGRSPDGTEYLGHTVHAVSVFDDAISAGQALGLECDKLSQVPTDFPATLHTSGHTYTMTGTSSELTFNGTGVRVSLGKGRYILRGRIVVKLSGATYASATDILFRYRRITNTSATLYTSTMTMEVMTTRTGTWLVAVLPDLAYNTAVDGDVVTLFGNVASLPSAGSILITEASLSAERLR